jgi:hypothetical protein
MLATVREESIGGQQNRQQAGRELHPPDCDAFTAALLIMLWIHRESQAYTP